MARVEGHLLRSTGPLPRRRRSHRLLTRYAWTRPGDTVVPLNNGSAKRDPSTAVQVGFLDATTPHETSDPTLHDVANIRRRLEFLALFSQPGLYEFEVIEHAWAGDD